MTTSIRHRNEERLSCGLTRSELMTQSRDVLLALPSVITSIKLMQDRYNFLPESVRVPLAFEIIDRTCDFITFIHYSAPLYRYQNPAVFDIKCRLIVWINSQLEPLATVTSHSLNDILS